jgi:hypothetical protein
MRITSAGDVGIGTSTTNTGKVSIVTTTGGGFPALYISGNDQSNVRVRLNNSGAGGTSFSIVGGTAGVSNSGLGFYDETNSVTRMQIDSSGNVGIGTSSPYAKLDVQNGSITVGQSAGTTQTNILFSGYGQVFGGATYGNVSIRSTYAGSNNSASLDFYTAPSGTSTSERMRLDSSGNLGLGVTPSAWGSNPAFELQQGAALFGFTNTTNLLQNAFYNGTNWIYKNTAGAMLYQVGRDAHRFFTAPSGTAGNAITFTQAMTLDASGNLAVGTTSADTTTLRLAPTNSDAVQRTLHIGYNGSMSSGVNGSYISFGNTTPSTNQLARIASFYEGGTYAGSLRFYTNTSTDGANPAERMRIDSSGNLLVGGTSASYSVAGRGLIEVNGSSESLIAFKIGGSTTNAVYQYNTTANFETNVTGSRYMNWTVNGSERMRIDSSGNLLVGTTSVLDLGKVSILYSSTNQNGITLKNSSTTFNQNAISFRNSSGTEVGYVYTTSSSTTYATSSDYRLKENVVPMTGALAKLSALKPCTYTWKADGSNGQGFIAHELAEVCPEAVVGEKDAVDSDDNPKYQGIDTSFLVATLTAAIQEQQAIINDLKARIETLESK